MLMMGKRTVRILLVVSVAALVCCGGPTKPPNVIILGIDTLRPDHLGCYGYQRDTSPNIDRLASRGTLFLNNISQAPWTLPSFGSLFTSLYPHQHGVTSTLSVIRDTFPTLATIMRDNGYSTGAILNSRLFNPEFGLNRGFDFYDAPGVNTRLADGTSRDALRWLDSQKGKPFLLFIHYFDPHEPYAPPAPYDTLYDPGYRGRIGNAFHLNEDFPGLVATNFEVIDWVTPEDWNHIRALYDGEIAFTDKSLGDLMDGLKKRGLLKNTLIVFMADHGEEFHEHGGFGHGHSLYGEVIRVPLIFSLPRLIPAGQRLSQQVRTIDIMPTVLDIVGVKTQARLEGVSLLPLLTGKGTVAAGEGRLFPPSMAYSEGLLRGDPQASVTAYPWKLVCNLVTNREVFLNLEQDPGELDNLIRQKPEPYPTFSDAFMRMLFTMGDTWYVEMADDNSGHSFDLSVVAANDQFLGRLHLYRLIDQSGRVMPTDAEPAAESADTRLVFKGLRPSQTLTLAFQVEAPPALPVALDFRIDGRPAIGRTFVGEALRAVRNMPFFLRTGRAGSKTWMPPAHKPEPPYILVWRVPGDQVSQVRPEINEETKRELRALGYIQ
jgi:arylsulfatase A-like enzyme